MTEIAADHRATVSRAVAAVPFVALGIATSRYLPNLDDRFAVAGLAATAILVGAAQQALP